MDNLEDYQNGSNMEDVHGLQPNELAKWLALPTSSYKNKIQNQLKYHHSMLTTVFKPHIDLIHNKR